MHYAFSAIRGVQAGREYYVTMCPLRLVPKIFMFDDVELDPILRAQRVINKSRVPTITQYIIDNSDSYVFSSITASIDRLVDFTPISNDPAHYNIGIIKVPMTAKIVVNDGQHRRAAIEQAIKAAPSLADETISIVLFIDEGLHRSQQMFADLNRYAIRPTQSLNILYDHRDPSASLAKSLVQEVSIFHGLTEMDKSTISNRSKNLFTLSGIYRATVELLEDFQDKEFSDQLKLAIEYWEAVSLQFPEWQEVKSGRLAAAALRRDFMNAHSIALVALGRAGRELLKHGDLWQVHVNRLKGIDWRRKNRALWEGRAMIGGKISFSRNNLLLMTCAIKKYLELPLTEDEQVAEETYQSAKSRRENIR